jgi:glutamate carboxypeptidase
MQADLIEYLHTVPFADYLGEWARMETGSDDTVGLAQFRMMLAERLGALGADIELVGATHALGRWPGQGQPILMLAHYDTVYPRGTLERQPVQVRDDKLFGPGVYDMKGGLLMACVAIEALRALDRQPRRPVWLLCTSDEERGSPTSRPLIEALARESGTALVLEPAGRDRSLKTARKGVGLYEIMIEGRAAHAGVAPQDGRSALVELAHQILWLHSLNDPATGTTVNVGAADGGIGFNVVPADAHALIDVRVCTVAESERIEHAMKTRLPVLDGVSVEITGGLNRPPMERTPAGLELFEHARSLAHELGFEVHETMTGGASDGNFTAALGVPTLDGLGPAGGGAHALDEHVDLDSFVPRTALLARMLQTL